MPVINCRFQKTVMSWKIVISAIAILTINWHCFAFKIKSDWATESDSNEDYSDVYLDSYQLIRKYGHKPEKHSVLTEDGYIVTLFRLVGNGPPVLLAHGITDSSDSWLVLGPSDSLAFLLAEVGFDVWLYNARGNKYSKDHVKNLTGKLYWDFSFEDLGCKDLTASIDHILGSTSRRKLSYVGFSQGATMFLAMGSLRPAFNSKVDLAILLAPVAWVDKVKLPWIKLFTKNYKALVSLFGSLGIEQAFPPSIALRDFYASACRKGRATKVFCDIGLINFGIINTANISPEKFPVISSHVPAGSSLKSFVHYLDNYRSKRFQRFNYGPKRNMKIYNSDEPPEYDVARITTPVVLLCSEVDWYSAIENVETLRRLLPNINKFIVLNKTLDFTHLEFTYGSRVKSVVNDVIINLLIDNS